MRANLTIPDHLRSSIVAFPLVPFPSDGTRAWEERVLAGAAPVASRARRSSTGWPYMLITDDRGRTSAFYRLFEYGFAAVADAPCDDALLAVFDSVCPAWQADGLVVCLADALAGGAR
jgi:hypothetical protein